MKGPGIMRLGISSTNTHMSVQEINEATMCKTENNGHFPANGKCWILNVPRRFISF